MRSVVPLAVALALVAVAPRAEANGRFPSSISVALRPGNEGDVYFGVTFGFILTHDDGAHWYWMCEDSIGYAGTWDPKYAIAPDGTIYATTPNALRVSTDGGCTFTTATEGNGDDLVGIWVDAIDVAPDGTVWLGTAESGLPNAVYRSTDRGVTVEKRGLETKTAWWKSLEIARSMPQRIYVSGYQVAPTVEVFLYRTDDAGASWTPLPTTGITLASSPLVLFEGVDPADPDIVYVRSVGAIAPVGDILYRSADAGQTWTPVLEVAGGIDAFTIRSDGDVVVGNVPAQEDTPGCTYRSTDRGVTFGACESGPRMACLGERSDGVLFACGDNWEPDFFALGRSSDAQAWSKTLRFHELAGPLACPAGTVQHDQCEVRVWPAIAEQLGVTGPVDGAPVDADPGVEGGGGGGCCDAGGGAAAAATILLAVLVGGLLVWRGRRRKRACCR